MPGIPIGTRGTEPVAITTVSGSSARIAAASAADSSRTSTPSRSITVDLFFLGLAVLVWMVLEARRLGMRFVWLYLVFGMLIAISVTVPIFLINRERKLAMREPDSPAGTLSPLDIAGLALVTAAIAVYTAITLRF